MIEHLDRLGASAEVIGAVNCVVRRDDELVGENTDGQGFLASLRTVADPAGRAIALFGAGGAARAIAVEAALAGAAHITVVNRDPGRGQELVSLLRTRTPARPTCSGVGRPPRLPDGRLGRRERDVDRARRDPRGPPRPRPRQACPPARSSPT